MSQKRHCVEEIRLICRRHNGDIGRLAPGMLGRALPEDIASLAGEVIKCSLVNDTEPSLAWSGSCIPEH